MPGFRRLQGSSEAPQGGHLPVKARLISRWRKPYTERVVAAKQAVKAASAYLAEMYGDTISDVLLEEIELIPHKSYWEIALSFARPTPLERGLAGMMGVGTGLKRHYRVVRVAAENGNVLA